MKIIILLSVFIAACFCGYTQPLKRIVCDEKMQPLPNATVSTLRAKDSLLLKTVITDGRGSFSLAVAPGQSLLLLVTAMGYTSQYLLVTDASADSIRLQKLVRQMKEVVVTAKKPLIELRPDKLIFNVAGSINATGSNALELLQKSPGVIVDKDDNIILSGKNGVRIYIDGKPSPLAGTDLAAYLRGMNSNDIEAIEIITNPSARYDAEGNAGIINIRLKKNTNYGWNGTITGGYGIGIYAKYNGGLSVNYRNKKINFFSNYTASNSRNENRLNFFRLQNDTSYDQRSTSFSTVASQNLKTGLDISLNKKSTLGFIVNASLGNTDVYTNSSTPITAAGSKAINRILTANGNSQYNRTNISTNINYRYADTSGRLLTIDADHGYYRLRTESITPNIYTDTSYSQTFSSYTFGTKTPTNITLFSIKADYEQTLGKGKLAAGFKSSHVKTDNDFSFYNYTAANQPVYDNQRSNHFIYTEWVNAVYGQYNGKWKNIDYQAGIRLEQTNSQGDLRTADTLQNKNVQRSYLNFFPSAGINWQMNANNAWGLTYSRRIDRPKYQDLNPFEDKIDELSYRKGNPFLRPQYTNSIELRHTYKYKLNTSLSYSDVQDFFAQVSDTIEGKRSFIMQRNLANQKILSLNFSYPFNITKWWSVYANAGVYHTRYRASFEQGKTIKLNATVATIYQQQTFLLGKKWTAELSGFFSSPSIWAGTYKTRSIGSLDAGLQKKCWHDNATFRLSISDIFLTMPWSGNSQFGGLYIAASGRWESRQLKLNFTYRFGNKKLKTDRSRTTGLEELNGRVN